MNDDILKPDRLAVTIAYRHFPFLKVCWQNDKTLGQDINQIGFLCFYESDRTYKDFYNRVQRELYSLSYALGFRRNRKNQWLRTEEKIEDELETKS